MRKNPKNFKNTLYEKQLKRSQIWFNGGPKQNTPNGRARAIKNHHAHRNALRDTNLPTKAPTFP